MSHIDGKAIKNSRVASSDASFGKGDYLIIVNNLNVIPAQKLKFTIVGKTGYAMPIKTFFGAVFGNVYEVKGDVEFLPEPNKDYIVKGELSEAESSVWIESVSSGEVVGKVEVAGSVK